jgi:phasin protein
MGPLRCGGRGQQRVRHQVFVTCNAPLLSARWREGSRSEVIMAKRTSEHIGTPADMSALWDMNGMSFELAEKAYRTWMTNAGRMQTEAIDFLNERLEKSLAVARELGNCKTPAEFFEVQAKYADGALADWFAESQKMAQLLGDIAKESASPTREEGSEHKRSAHRSSTH